VRAAIPALLVGCVALLVSPAAVPQAQPAKPQFEVAPPPHDKPDPARDLKLVTSFDAKRVEAGAVPYITLTLVNTSKNVTYPVVKPGDGSEAGWREPFVHFTAEQLNVQGEWTPLQTFGRGRCGLFDWKWQKDVIDLKPGEKLVVTNEWIPAADFRLQQPGKVRVRGHYEYRAGVGKGGRVQPGEDLGRMARMPAFAIQSEPVEFDVIRPLDLRVRVKKALKVGVEMKVSDVIDVTLTNTTGESITVRTGGQKAAGFDLIGGGPEANQPQLTDYATEYGKLTLLKAGQTASLLGAGEFANGGDGTWTGRKPGKYVIRVGYSVSDDPNTSRGQVVEAFAEVPVEE
jgi:hypothetical protein